MATNGHGRRNDLDDKIVLALAAGSTVKTTAVKLECSERLIYRRLKEEGFRARVDEARSEIVSRTIGKLAALGVRAVSVLKEVASKSEDDNTRVRAALGILANIFKGMETETLARRLRELGEAIEKGAARGDGNNGAAGGTAVEGGAPAADSGAEPAGSAAPGPEPDPDGSGSDPGQMASGPPPQPLFADPDVRITPERQEPDSRSAGNS
jgi:hypothetical protein